MNTVTRAESRRTSWQGRKLARGIIFSAPIIACMSTLSACQPIADWTAGKIYASLSEPWESEAPRTFTSYPSSPETQAIIGAGGRSLDCSIPSWADVAFRTPSNSLSDVRLRFRQACVNHDFCYRHGFATYGYSQNDCDMMLQQSSYRLCRQVFQRDSVSKQSGAATKEKPFAFCEAEARKVLLGVALGGAGSYMGAGRSTYFEYDPMPSVADDYVVARAVPAKPQAQGSPIDMGIRTFYIKRNSVVMSALRDLNGMTIRAETSKSTVFPDQRIATPPQWVRTPGAATLASVARDNFADTSVAVYTFDYSTPFDGHPFGIRRCGADGGSGLRCLDMDADASVSKLVLLDDGIGLLSLSHRIGIPLQGSPKKLSGVTPTIILQHLAGPSEPEILRLDSRTVSANARFLQHDVLLESDANGKSTHAWVLARGMTVTMDGKHFEQTDEHEHAASTASSPCDDAVRNYRTCVAVARQELKAGGKVQLFAISPSEKNEPLNIIRLADGSAALVGLEWSADDFDRVINHKVPKDAARFRFWIPTNDGNLSEAGFTASLPDETRAGFLEMPAIVMNVHGVREPLLILTRVTALVDEDEANAEAANSRRLQLAHLETVISKIEGGSGKPLRVSRLGSAHCSIRIGDQLLLKDVTGARRIRQHANRAYDRSADATIESGTPAWRRGLLELGQRWKMSQIVASDPYEEAPSQTIALTAVFNGFTDMSIQMRLRIDEASAKFDRQLGGKGFADCEAGLDTMLVAMQ
ncbi:hypothetical protein AWB77_01472 [Caballeronia fortuita]|uniref:Uncharacterized protein n=1 Tax=Caballeronia fortuita TaxID=1777138 RepID=A0A158A895_9BURK|nr:hypothetical protein [Caballeronia fortuita]SAK53836.1 hypothetical protein AWB77_01472 [Caballeronia fortuita]